MNAEEMVITQTRKWIHDVVVGCNFCPFAAREIKRNSVGCVVVEKGNIKSVLEALATAFEKMDADESVETLLLLFPGAFASFDAYLRLVHLSEQFLEEQHYEGVYQLASFHPLYLFAGASTDDPANYTNRSPYPMLQILREQSVTIAIDSYADTERIPENNIAFARKQGLTAMQALRAACIDIKESNSTKDIEEK